MMKSSKEDAAERALAALLDVLASMLIPLEVTPARLAQIARASFVKACAVEARMRSSGRPHLARIAARTGLSRAEVKRVVAAKYTFGPREPESSPRSLRVLNAWQTSAGYSRAKRGFSLRVTGPYPSFQTLCRDFSGDIPYKVILTELERLRRVRRSKKKTKISIVTSSKLRAPFQRDLSNLVFAASLLNDLAQSERVLLRRREKISAATSIQDSYVENAISSRVTALLDNLPELFVSQTKSRKNTNRVNVYTLVSKCVRYKKQRS
jgi:hypothetical protein